MGQKFQGPDGTIYEQVEGGYRVVSEGGPVTIGTPDPGAALDRTLKSLRVQDAMRDAARAPIQQQADAVQLERQRIALENDRRAASAAPTGKPLRQGDGDKLEKETGTYEALKGALGSFQDEYAGNALTGGLENTGQRLFGTGTPGQSDWWANFRSTDNQIRNALFGASLTEGEKQAYNATTISERMKPDQIRQNLSRRAEIVRKALTRRVDRLKAGGYNAAEIDAATGEFGADFTRDYKPQAQPETTDKTTRFYMDAADDQGNGGGPTEISAPTGPTITETDPALAGVNARVNAMLKSGASDDQIKTYLSNAGVNPGATTLDRALDFRRKNTGYRGNYEVAVDTRQVPQSGARQAFQAIGAGPLGSYATSAADALTAGRLDNIAGAVGGNQEQVNAAKELLAKTNPYASLAGTVTGGALAAAGLEAGLARSGLTAATGIAGQLARSPYAADAAYGAAFGSDEGGATGAVLGGALGVAGGALGQRVVRAAGGVRDQAVQGLRAAGVPLTVGQAIGNSGRLGAAVKLAEDGITGLPFIGAMGQARRREGVEAFNRVAFDEALAPIGRTGVGVIGEEGIDAARIARNDAYGQALDNVRLAPDAQFNADIAAARTPRTPLPDDMTTRANFAIDRAGENIENGSLTGRGMQQALRRFRRTTRENAPLPNGGDLGDVMRAAEGAYTDLAGRQAPAVMPALNAANAANMRIETLRSAVDRAKNAGGTFTPAQLTMSAAQAARQFGNNAGTTQQPFYALTRAAQDVLPSQVPDSGTATRLALTGAITGAGATGGYFSGDTGTGAAVGLGLAGLQSRLAQQALTRVLLDRAPRTRAVIDRLEQLGVGRAIGAPAALQVLPAR